MRLAALEAHLETHPLPVMFIQCEPPREIDLDTTWMDDDQLDAWARAGELVGRGWSIVPIKAGTKRPPFKGWEQYWERKPTGGEIEGWIRAGILDWGIMCGPISNLVVVDLDDDEARAWASEQGLATGPVVATGKGWHHYFSADGNADLVKIIKFAGHNMDVLTKGGMVLAPGSRHPNGGVYEWIDSTEPLVPLPGWIRKGGRQAQAGASPEAVRTNVGKNDETPEAAVIHMAHGAMPTVTEGGRNDQMHKVAAAARGKEGLEYNEIVARLIEENERICSPPLPQSELETIARSAMRYDAGMKRYSVTDEGNLMRLIDILDGNLRYVSNAGMWIAWNGKQWVEESELMIQYLARRSNAMILGEIKNPSLDADERKALMKHYNRSMSHGRIDSVAKMAKADPNLWIDATELDSDPFLFNCPNGTLDLRTGKLRAHSREDFITRMGKVDFKAELMDVPFDDLMKSSWIRFCRGMFSDYETREMEDGTIEYFQRLMGYWLTGNTKEQKWFLWRGTGANGKSTTTKVLSRIFGDYAIYLDVKSFMKQGRNSEANMARARGMRLVMTSEPSPGSQLDETLMKTATGGGAVEARFLYQKPFAYVPTWKIMMEANSRPQVSGGDEGNYRRIQELDFRGNFMQWPSERSEQYHYGFSRSIDSDLSAEIEMIFAWMVAGCLKWWKGGLQAPKRVEHASTQYREEMDTIQSFLADVAIRSRHYKVSSKELNECYRLWAIANGEDPERSARWLSFRLTEKGMEKTTIQKGVRGYSGMMILPGVLDELKAKIVE